MKAVGCRLRFVMSSGYDMMMTGCKENKDCSMKEQL